MHPDVDELRPKLKEILYDCAVDIKATKAALYLLDIAIRKFELVTEYGFRSAIPQSTSFNHPLVDRCARTRTPFYVNTVGADPKLSQVLFDAASERLLVAPLFSRGELVGLIDMRDKAGKQPFAQTDVARAQTIAEKILGVFASMNIFNQRFITLADVEMVHSSNTADRAETDRIPVLNAAPQAFEAPPIAPVAAPPLPSRAKRAKPAAPDPAAQQTQTARLMALPTLIKEARAQAVKVAEPPQPRAFGESELRAVRDVLRGMLYLPGSLAASFTMTSAAGGLQEVAAKNRLSDEARNTLEAKLQAWLTKRGEATGSPRVSIQTPFGEAGEPISASQLQKVYTAPLNVTGYRGLYLTVAFAETPDRSTHELLAALLNQLQLAIEVSNSRDAVEQLRVRAAARLLEPPFTSYPELRRHSEMVAARSAAFAQYLDLPATEVETVTLTALVHDAGMRLLDYDRLYSKPEITADELALLREHPVVGAAMVEPLLGHEVARAVLCHHERVDGSGYPNEMRGDQIPLPSRILQICDTYVTLTDPQGYQRPRTPAEALAVITRGAGAQFDAALAKKFTEMMGSQ